MNRHLKKVARSVLVLLMAAVTVCGIVSVPYAYGVEYSAAYINKLEGLEVDYSDYIDSSIMQQLPESVSKTQDISVIITVDVPNLMDAYEQTDKTMSFAEYALNSQEAADIEAEIQTEKARILSLLDEQEVTYTLGDDYSRLLSGFEIVIKAGVFDTVCKCLGEGEGTMVSEEYLPADTQLVENTVNMYDTGIFDSSESGYDGSGMVVAVLDTGLDSNHTAFSVNNFTSEKLGLTYEEVAAVLGNTKANEMYGGLSVDDVYINKKVPFGYDYADNDPDPYSTHNNHGTHVSGVIVGKDDTITGVAPNAQLVSMKTFSDVMDTARSTWILSALEDCVVLGVDVINMSLGTSCGFSRETDEEQMWGVYDKIRAAGISMVVAASNSFSSAYGSEANGNLGLTSNPDTGTVGSPSTYEGVLSVASINGKETPYLKYGKTIIYFDEANTAAGKERDFVQTLLGDKKSKDFEYVVVPGVGRSADYTGLDVKGKIALVRRGDNTFEEKAVIAEGQGAAGIIIYNNVSGEIKMNVGDAQLAVCSITQDAGEMLAAAGNGKLTISSKQTSGPFISDFSSWGPTPSLNIKPEITAHGGNILSAVTGGSYDRLSGTSMACPNLAGVVVLLRQYVVENFPDIANDNVKVNAMVNRLMMSTADIANNTNGLPYAVRKQGAGLANLLNSINTTAYITTYDRNGNAMDKTKLELGDDPNKTGVYTMNFTVNNFGKKKLTYELGAYVLTEGVSDTKTNAGKTTVTEEAYALEGATIEAVCTAGGKISGKKLTVKAGESADVTVTITLSDEDKKYLDASFENGMYVEGFVTLKAKSGTKVDMNVPYLAYYGDWTVAPLFDLTYYDTNADELDKALSEEDKTKADAYATRPVGGVSDDYVSYLGTYYFMQDPNDMVIAANENFVALSNQVGTIHSLRFVWAGLLRNAERIEVKITDDVTGEVLFETVDDDVRKSYGDGGSIYPANVEIEFDTMDYNMANNSKYTVTLTGYLDYGDGGLETNKKNVFSFPLTVDFEAPTVTDVEYYYEYDDAKDRNRLYAKVSVFDNHYSMAAQLGYVTNSEDEDGNAMVELKSFEQYMTPIYSQENDTTVVTFELTDYLFNIKEGAINPNSFVLTCYDYALNYATYEIGLPDNFVDFCFDGLEEGLTLSPNEVYNLEPLVYPATEWGELLEITSNRAGVVRVVNNKLVAGSSGKAIVKVRDPKSEKSITFTVTVLDENDENFQYFDKPVADVFRLDGYKTLKAYYMVNSEDKKIGDTGDLRFFEGNYNLEMYPSESLRLTYDLDAYFPNDTTVAFESSNESIVKIDETGIVTAVAEGYASVTIKVMMDGNSTLESRTVSVEVKDPFVTTAATLTHYYGLGGQVNVPADLDLTEIGAFAFSNFEYVMKTPEELAFDDAETSKQWYIGDNTVTKVVLPEGIEKIGAYAFANLTALEEIVLPSTLEAIEYGAFYGCSKLEKITFSGENNLKIINQSAFEGCDLRGNLDLSSVCIISGYAFAGNQKLEGVTTGDALISIGQSAFASCKKLANITITAEKVKYGPFAFDDCDALTSFTVRSAVIPTSMFYRCDNLESVTIGKDVMDIGEHAFLDTKVTSFTVEAGNAAYKAQTADHVLSADGTVLVVAAPTAEGEYSAANLGNANITTIGKGAFSHNDTVTSVNLPSVTRVEDHGLDSSKWIDTVTLGQLTYVGEYAFYGTAITQLPAFTAETTMGKYAFANTKITNVVIPDGMVVTEGLFSHCIDLASITIGNDVTLETNAFTITKDEGMRVLNRDTEHDKYFYVELYSGLRSLTIGDNAVIGDNAFSGHASIDAVTLGANAQIGYMAFYNCTSLRSIDLSKATVIGDYAFSGDVYYEYLDEATSQPALSPEGVYLNTYHAPALSVVDLTAATSVGEYAFTYCRDLVEVTLNENITNIPQYAFAGCIALQNIDLSKVQTFGEYAFMESEQLAAVDLSAATTIGKYAFVNGKILSSVTLNPEGTVVEEGAFAYCQQLADVQNMNMVTNLGDYALAYTGVVEADLTAATHIGTHAFMKEEETEFTVTLGESLQTMGDNPFAMCKLKPFCLTEVETFNGQEFVSYIYDYQISSTVSVIDGSLYCQTVNGLELITYAAPEHSDFHVAEDTVRIAAMAFACSDVQKVTLPYTVGSLGHKAFFQCDDLQLVVFNSYNAPILEEEFDPTYYETLTHIPATGDYTVIDLNNNEYDIPGMGLIPYFIWNAADGMYSNVFYGATFKDYVGYVDQKITMVRPVNGQHYDSFIFNQYFEETLYGPSGADEVTVAAINAIKAIPERVTYEHKALVEKARELYNKIATTEQQSLVFNYGDLITAEQRVAAETPTDTPVEDGTGTQSSSGGNKVLTLVLSILVTIAALTYLIISGAVNTVKKWFTNAAQKAKKVVPAKKAEKPAEEVAEEVTEEVAEEAAEEVTEEVTEEVAEEVTEEVSEEVAEETVEEVTEEVTEEVAEEVTEEVAEEEIPENE